MCESRLLHFEIVILQFESALFLHFWYFKKAMYFKGILSYFENILFHFESIILYIGSILLYFGNILSTLKVYSCTL